PGRIGSGMRSGGRFALQGRAATSRWSGGTAKLMPHDRAIVTETGRRTGRRRRGPPGGAPKTTIFSEPLSKTVSRRGEPMRNTLLRLAGLTLFALPLSAQTADDIIAKYIKTVGGMDRIQAVTRSEERRVGQARCGRGGRGEE